MSLDTSKVPKDVTRLNVCFVMIKERLLEEKGQTRGVKRLYSNVITE